MNPLRISRFDYLILFLVYDYQVRYIDYVLPIKYDVRFLFLYWFYLFRYNWTDLLR